MKIQILSVYFLNTSDKSDFCNEYENMDDFEAGRIFAFLKRNRIDVSMDYLNCMEPQNAFDKIDTEADLFVFYGTNNSRAFTYDVLNKLKTMNSKVIGCMCGRVTTESTDTILDECPEMDFVVIGYAEYPVLDVIKKLEKGETLEEIVKNHPHIKSHKIREGKAFCNTDINLLPWPDRSFLKFENGMTAYISTSHGCVANCTFCRISNQHQRWTGRSVQEFINEVISIYETKGIKFFAIRDCSFEDPGEMGKERIKQICLGLLEYPVRFGFRCFIRAESFKDTPEDREIINLMKEAGFRIILIGIEAGNDEDLILYNKIARVKDNEEAIKVFSKCGIEPMYGFIMMNPYSNANKLKANYEFLVKYKDYHLDDYINALRVFHNTPIYEQLQEAHLLINGHIEQAYYGYHFVDEHVNNIFEFVREYFHNARDLTIKDLEFWDFMHFYNRMQATMNGMEKIIDQVEELKLQIAEKIIAYFEPLYMQGDIETCKKQFESFKEEILVLYSKVEKIKFKLLRIQIKQQIV